MGEFYLEFPLKGASGTGGAGPPKVAVSGAPGHIFVRGGFPWCGGTVHLFGRFYRPGDEEGLRGWAASFDPADPGAWARRCDGDFVALAHESRGGRVWVIADRNGQRRLYISVEEGVFRAGDTLLSVASKMARPRLDPVGVFHLLALRYSLDPTTLVEGVWSTAPGLYFEVNAAGVKAVRYYAPVRYDSEYFATMNECVEGLDVAFRAAFSKRFDSSRRCVVLLSGGIDSVAMLRYLTEVAPRRVEAFTYGLKGDEHGAEVRSAQMAARHFNVPHHLHLVTPSDVVKRFTTSFREADGPHYAVSLYADLKIPLLQGEGAVDLYSGQDTRLHTPSFDAPRVLGVRLTQAGFAPLNGLWKMALGASKAWPWRGKRTLAYWRKASEPLDYIGEYLVRSILNVPGEYAGPRIDALSRDLHRALSGADIQEVFKAVIAFEYRTQFTDDMNNFASVVSDINVGIQFPFYDHDLVSVCNRIPYAIGARHIFTTHSWSWIPFTQKAVLRKLLLKSVPVELVYRRKATLPTMHVAFNAGLRDLLVYVYDRFGEPLMAALDPENGAHARRIMGAVRRTPAPYRFPEEHDLAWDGYSVGYLAVLQQVLSGNRAVFDELDAVSKSVATASRCRGAAS